MIPVVITHFGRPRVSQEFVQIALRQAGKQNSKVILLGDESNKDFPAEHHYLKDYSRGAEELQLYYIHMSTDDPKMNIFNTQRYLMILEFMEAHGYNEVFTCDSDVMVHCNVEAERKRLGRFDAAYNIPMTQSSVRVVAMGNGYWTLEALRAFRLFVREAYTEEKWLSRMRYMWGWHVRTGTRGGVSDMMLLNLFSETDTVVVNLAEVQGGAVFDHAISTGENWLPGEYRTVQYRGWTLKKIEWRAGVPYAYNLLLNRWIRFCTLHYQGGRKEMLVRGTWNKSR